MAGNFTKLDTKHFAEAANLAKHLAELLEETIEKADTAVNAMYSDWAGDGRNEFEKKYKLFEKQANDICRGLYDLYEDIVTAETTYIQEDCDKAKAEIGINQNYQ